MRLAVVLVLALQLRSTLPTLLSLPLTLRHRESRVHTRLALSSLPELRSFCAAHSVSAARCSFLRDALRRRIDNARGPIVAAVTVRVRFASGASLTDLSLRHANETSMQASHRFCTKYGVSDCTGIEIALRAQRLVGTPVASELKLELPHQRGIDWVIQLHECETVESVARLECLLAGLTTPEQCSVLRELDPSPGSSSCTSEPQMGSAPNEVVQVSSYYSGYSQALVAHRVRVSFEYFCSLYSLYRGVAYSCCYRGLSGL